MYIMMFVNVIIEAICNVVKNISLWWKRRRERKMEEEKYLFDMECDALTYIQMKLDKFPANYVVVPKFLMKMVDEKKFSEYRCAKFRNSFDVAFLKFKRIKGDYDLLMAWNVGELIEWNQEKDVIFFNKK